MMEAIGKERCKRQYLDVFMDLLMRNIESKTASAISKHAAVSCAYELSKLVGPNIFRGRIYDDYQREAFDRAIRERQMQQERSPREQGTQFSPFEPPGLLDNLDSHQFSKFSPGLPPGLSNAHTGVGAGTSF